MSILKKIHIPKLLVQMEINSVCRAQFVVQNKCNQNSLGFEPLELHTKMGFTVPVFITGAVLLLTQKDTSLHQRTRVYTEAAMTSDYNTYSTLFRHNIGINVQLRKWLLVATEFSATLPFDNYNESVGFAIRPFAQFYAVNLATWKQWFVAGGSLIYFTGYFPKPTEQDDRLGTHLNGTTKYGIGALARLRRHVQLLVRVRHLHISNGNTQGEDRNLWYGSMGLFAGLPLGF